MPISDHGKGSAGRGGQPQNTNRSDNVTGRGDKVGRTSGLAWLWESLSWAGARARLSLLTGVTSVTQARRGPRCDISVVCRQPWQSMALVGIPPWIQRVRRLEAVREPDRLSWSWLLPWRRQALNTRYHRDVVGEFGYRGKFMGCQSSFPALLCVPASSATPPSLSCPF